jgi:glycine/D-amino acid oxidase-like deaminating enzyme
MLSVAVLGAGIMGCCAALRLARAGCTVTLVDQATAPMSCASRWNEGKIHLGFLYAGDSSGRTAAELLPGGLAFKALVEELIESSIATAVTADDEIYLVHPYSVVDAGAMERYFRSLEARLLTFRQTANYLAPITRVERLDGRTLRNLADGSVAAGFRVPERSVNTTWLADRLAGAVATEPRIRLVMRTRVSGVAPSALPWSGPWRLDCRPEIDEEFDVVVNALWEGLLAVDRSLGLEPEWQWSHRFRLALFIKTGRRVCLPSMILATGPFGDVKNYDGYHFYLSWYPAGLVASGEEIEPPTDPPVPPPEDMIARTAAGLTRYLPQVSEIMDAATNIQVAGGWVFALGRGSLADRAASLHRRDRFGIRHRGAYYSVNTGKYSTAPWLASRLSDEIMQSSRSFG